MSGGAFDYGNYKIREIHESIQDELNMQGKEKPENNLAYWDDEYLKKYPEERFETTYPENIQQIFKDAIKALKIAEVYAQRVDYYLSGDDGDESLVSRLKEELDNIS